MDSPVKAVNLWEDANRDKQKELITASLEKVLIVVGHQSTGILSFIQGKTSFLKVVKNEA